MRTLASLLAVALVATSRGLTSAGNPVSNAVRTMAVSSGKHLLGAAEAMPADKYGFKPTPAQWSFGELIAHIQGDNRTTCAAFSGMKPADEPKPSPTDGKEKLVAALQRSLTFCDAALAKLTDATLGDTITWYGDKTTRAMAAIGLVADWADHYGQQAIYLRLNGVLPPTAKK